MIKIIFVDIDWTIFDHSKHPSTFDFESIKALKNAQEQGIKVFLCTARPYHSIKQIKLFDLISPDGIICSNGGLILYQGEIIYRSHIPTNDFEFLCELATKYNANVEGVRPFDCFIINDRYDEIKKVHQTYPEEMPHIEDYHDQDVIGVGLFIPKEYDEIFQKSLVNLSYYFRYHEFGVDISNVIHDKGISVKFVLDYLGILKDESASFGDDIQDISMFKETNYSFAMDNAKDEIKKEAKFITSSVTNHGVKVALDKLIMKNN